MRNLYISIIGLTFATMIILNINFDKALTQLSPTPAPTQGSDEDSFANELNLLGIDLECKPLCWNDFIVGETLAKDVYLWFYQNLSDDEYISVPYLPDYETEHNFIQYNSEIMLIAFPDATQSPPRLRGYSFSFSVERLVESNLATAVSKEIVSNWLPDAVVEQYEKPSTIFIGKNYLGEADDYFMMLNYEEENFSVLYWYNPTETDVTTLDICADHIIESISVLVYSNTEADLNTLVDDLDGYFEFTWLPHVNALRRFDTTIYSEEELEGFVDQISEVDCISG